MTANGKGGEVVRPHKFAARTSEGQQRQRANLTPTAAVKHAAYSEGELRLAREAILGEMVGSFPAVRRDRLEIAAGQRARIKLITDYIDGVGIIAHRKRGTFHPVIALLQREEAAYRAELTRIEELHDQAGANAGRTLEHVLGEIAAGGGREDGAGRPPPVERAGSPSESGRGHE
jgi:hypothetical protein